MFKLLKLFGLDVRAKVAAAKSVIEQHAEEVSQYAGQTVQTAAVIAALSALAGVLGAMAVGVGLYALYRVDADIYGVYAGLGVVGGVLVAAALIPFLIVRPKGQSLSGRRIFRPLRPIPVTASSPAPVVATADRASVSYHAPGEVHPETARDMLEPLAFPLPKYIKYPALGHPVLDEFVENLGAAARETADGAVERAANLVRYGDRQQLVALLSGAVFVGWLLRRRLNSSNPASTTPRLSDSPKANQPTNRIGHVASRVSAAFVRFGRMIMSLGSTAESPPTYPLAGVTK